MSEPQSFNGLVFKAFYNDESLWVGDAYVEDFAWHTQRWNQAECESKDVEEIGDDDLVFVDAGYILTDKVFPTGHLFAGKSEVDFEQALVAWMDNKGLRKTGTTLVNLRFDRVRLSTQELVDFVRSKDPNATLVDGTTLKVIE